MIMRTTNNHNRFATAALCLVAAMFHFAPAAQGGELINFQFNEGSGSNITDTASGLVGVFGLQQDPAVDTLALINASPSGQAGDRSLTNSGEAFLLVDDSVNPILNLTNHPLTIETWIFIDPFSPATSAEGIAAYGNSYKMGLKSGYQVFTLYGQVDITNNAAGPIAAGSWVHLAAAWEPGAGVHFYVNGQESFEAVTNAAARPPQHNYLSIASEGFGNNVVAALDRLRIHRGLLTAVELDSVAGTPKPVTADTLVAYNFNENNFPSQSSAAAPRPTISSLVHMPAMTSPVWTNDTPTGQAGDFALAFVKGDAPIKEVVTVSAGGATVVDLGVNNSNYTLQAWVKLPTRLPADRMVLLRTDGPPPRISLSIHTDRTLHTTVLGTADFTTSVRIPNDNRWHHIAAVMENDFGRLQFYLDGVNRQTVNRTQTALPTSGSPARLLIGKESDTRYFQGLVDRVHIHDVPLSVAELDFPAVPGLPMYTEQPVDVVVDNDATATFSATVTADSDQSFSFQWFYASNRCDTSGTSIPGATSTSLSVSNAGVARQGFYYLVASNSVGAVHSHPAKLTVRTAPGLLQPLWSLQPGERPYLTGYTSSATTRDLERGMAYNPATGHLLIGARWTSPNVKGIYIVDAATGAHVGELPGVSNIISGGTIVLTRVAAAEDGAIYAVNFGTLTDANPLKIYRWANETAEPAIAYQGNPVAGLAANQQWGKNMIVRGAGTNTQILLDTRTTLLALFTTQDGQSFAPTVINAQARIDEWGSGMAWGEGETFWGKFSAEPLTQWALNPEANSASIVQSFAEFPRDGFANFSFSADGKYLAGLVVQDGPDAVEVYDVSDPSRAPILLDSGLFTSDNPHTVGYGNVYVIGSRVYALNPNNGLIAFEVATSTPPSVAISQSGADVRLAWPADLDNYELVSSPSLVAPTWTVVPHLTVGNENVATQPATGNSMFYRLRQKP